MSRQKNSVRKLNGLFSVDSWHAAFDENTAVVDLFIDVTFETGRFGGEEESEILFKASLKRAKLIVVLPEDGSKYTVEPASVVRMQPRKTQVSRVKTISKSISANGEFSLLKNMSASAGASAKADNTEEESRTSNIEEPTITVQHGKEGENYCWTLSSSEAHGVMNGPAWDSTIPWMKIRDDSDAVKRQRAADKHMIEPVTVLIRCLREDLVIDNIRYKDPEKNSILAKINPSERKLKMATAEAIIKKQLLDSGLEPPEISEQNAYAEILLADVLVRIERPMTSIE